MNDRAARIAKLSPEQRQLLESMLQNRTQKARADKAIPVLPRCSEGGQPEIFPLSSRQRWVWSLEQPSNTASNNVAHTAMRLRGPLDVAALKVSLHEVCARHETLRTTFGTRDGEPVQIVGPPRPVPLSLVDLRGLPPQAREAEAERLLVREAGRTFDLSSDLMLRVALVRLNDEEHLLLPVMHHIVSDDRSLEVLYRELWALYEASRSGERASLPELPVRYTDFVVWQRQRQQNGALRRSTEYWKERLADPPEALKVPTDRRSSRRQTPVDTKRELLRMPVSLGQELDALCRRQNVTLYMVLLAAWAALLHRYSGQDDIMIGTTFANRNRVEVEGLIGFFANVLVLRHDLAGDPLFAELLGRVREMAVDAFSHGELSFEELPEELSLKYRAAFALRRTPRSYLKIDGLEIERIEIDYSASTRFLTLIMIESHEGLTARVDYNAGLFKAATAARMLEDLRSLLGSIVADPEQRLSGLVLPIEVAGGRRDRFGKRLRRAAWHARRRVMRALRRTRRAVRRRPG